MDRLRLLIAGGDMRQIFCAECLAEKYDIYTLGIDEELFPQCRASKNADELDGLCDGAILPVPPLDETGSISSPCCKKCVAAENVAKMLKKNAPVFIGREDCRLKSIFGCRPVYNYMSAEDACLKNAIPTAEGAVKIALDELPVTLNGLPVLIVGLGRIGMSLAMILKGFGANVTAAVHNAKGAAKARILGINSVCTQDIRGGFGLVFNTVPELIFDEDMLKRFTAETLFIDLASRPGGFDLNCAADMGMKVLWALGLPGKTAPVTAGRIVAETVDGMLEGGVRHG